MKYIKSDHGYALLLTLLILIVFTVLGMSVLGMSLSGEERNNTREEIVQAKDLAAKGIDHIAAQITSELNALISNEGISAYDYINGKNDLKGLKATIQQYNCVGGTNIITENATAETGNNYTVCIDKIDIDPESKVTIKNKEEHLRRILTFKSIGTSVGKTQTLYSKYNIGATNYPESLNYAVGAYKVDEATKQKFKNEKNLKGESRFPALEREGNLFLNGGVSITGDMKVDSNLIISKHGFYPDKPDSPDSNYSIKDSVAPQFLGFGGRDPKLFLGGILRNFTGQYGISSLSNQTYKDYKNEHPRLNNSTYYKTDPLPADLYYQSAVPDRVSAETKITPINFKQKLEQLVEKGVKVKSKCEKNLSGFQIFSGNCDISGTNKLTGTSYVKGDLTITDAKLENNIIFYVDGDVSIQESTLNGLNGGSLIIFAKGNINLIENSLQLDEPSKIKGYFYSEKEMEIFGVYSNIKITGGISARKIILNALRGNWSGWIFKRPPTVSEQNKSSSKSRLDITYDEEIIKTFSALDATTEPWIDNVSPPIELERSYTP